MTLHRTATWLITGTILLAGGHAWAQEQPGNPLRLKTFVVEDPDLQMPAFRVLIPADWQGQGRVIWRPNAAMPATGTITAWNPAGGEAVRIYPHIPFVDGVRESGVQAAGIAGPDAQFFLNAFPEGSSYIGNEVRRFVGGPKEYVTNIVLPRLRPDIKNYRVIAVEAMPKWAQETATQAGSMPGVTVHVQAARVRIEYADNGRTLHEDFYILLPRVSSNGVSFWGTESASSVRAEAGKLDAANKIHNAMLVSFKIDLGWFNIERQISQMLMRNFYENQNRIMELSRYIARNNDRISDIISSTYWNRQRSLDRIHYNFSQYIRGVESYIPPGSSHRVELPSGYNHAWVNGLGEYILTDNPFFNPGGNWTQMKKTR